MRIYVIDKDYQATEIEVADAASRFMTWLTDRVNPALTELIQTWLLQPRDAGGLGALADTDSDVAALQAEITALFRGTQRPGVPDGREAP